MGPAPYAHVLNLCNKWFGAPRLINDLNVISDANSANTRASSNGNILVPVPHVEQFRNSFKYRGAVVWNTLPRDIRGAQNIDEFKYRYRKH